MKTLVLGGSGFVGHYLMKYFDGIGTSSIEREGYTKLDITNREEITAVFQREKPDLIINSAAMSDVDFCEKRREMAMRINGESVEWIARSANIINSRFVQISTDYVFDGEKGDYREVDKPNPINAYGESKLIGEADALRHNSLVLRIEMPYGLNLAKNKNVFFESAVRNLRDGKIINAAIDQIISPTFVEDIPKAIYALISKNRTGVFHLASIEQLSRYEFVKKIAEVFGFDDKNVNATHLDDFKLVAKRPKKTSLNMGKISSIFNVDTLEMNLKRIKKSYKI